MIKYKNKKTSKSTTKMPGPPPPGNPKYIKQWKRNLKLVELLGINK